MSLQDDIPALKEAYLKYYRELPVQLLAAAKIGRTDDTILNWRKADPEFDRKVEEAKADWAMEHAKKVRSREWLLERVMKQHFAARTELTGADGKDLPTPIVDIHVPDNHSVPKDQSSQ